jgi:hypothetical protein
VRLGHCEFVSQVIHGASREEAAEGSSSVPSGFLL